jgi:hypothetical protein
MAIAESFRIYGRDFDTRKEAEELLSRLSGEHDIVDDSGYVYHEYKMFGIKHKSRYYQSKFSVVPKELGKYYGGINAFDTE